MSSAVPITDLNMSDSDAQCGNTIIKSEKKPADDNKGLNFALDLDVSHQPEFVAEALEFPRSPYHMNQVSTPSIDEQQPVLAQAVNQNTFMEPLRRVSGGLTAPPKRYFRAFWRALTWKMLDKNNRPACQRK